MKKLTAMLLSLAFCFCIFTSHISAAEISLFTMTGAKPHVKLTISGGKATCYTSVAAASNVNKIYTIQYFEKHWIFWAWNQVNTFKKTTSGYTQSFTNTQSGLDGGTYRIRAEFYCYYYSGSTLENEMTVDYSSEVTI